MPRARPGLPREVPVVTLATAHPAKFRDAVERATGQRPALPARIGDLFEREERLVELPGDYAAIADYVASACGAAWLMADLLAAGRDDRRGLGRLWPGR